MLPTTTNDGSIPNLFNTSCLSLLNPSIFDSYLISAPRISSLLNIGLKKKWKYAGTPITYSWIKASSGLLIKP